MKYKTLIDKSIQDDNGESAMQYMFIEVPYIDGKTISQDELGDFFSEEFERRINSSYDCSGKWFTSLITTKIVDDNDWDETLLIACTVSWGLDV